MIVIATGGAAAVSGFSADLFGYATHFATATILCLAAVWLVWRCAHLRAGAPALIRAVVSRG